ncbi:MAG: rod shape-determining protein MreD [Selenomonas sp.]|uniref:rod shape-determining protein MreD n=1 Tax=unclassified Selenomonas TaxID=2637378 RepID=UPI00068F00C5|nr:rod shape-determining protein MreD [Selenomonas sp.]SEH30937.1 rod shape-determining protein MreD [Selenomonas ruminantium]
MKKIGKWAAFAAALFVLQTSILPLMAYHGITADLMLLLTVSFAFLRGAKQGAFMGFSVGLMQDLATGTYFGVNTLARTLMGLLFGQFSDRVFKEQFFLPVLASMAVTILNYFILALLMVLLGYRFNLESHMQQMLVPMLLYQLAFAYPVHYLTYRLDKRLEEKK